MGVYVCSLCTVQAATLHKGMSNKMANSDKTNSWQSHGSQMSYGQSQDL